MVFCPQDCEYLLATVDGSSTSEKRRLLSEWLLAWLELKTVCGEKGCVIFDIDDTLVDSKDRCFKEIHVVYNLCLTMGIRIYIITARPDTPRNRKLTETMLHMNGYTHYEYMFMMPVMIQPTQLAISMFKETAQISIAKVHTILASCGDRWSDHCRFPSEVLVDRSDDEWAIAFLPGMEHPSIKLSTEKYIEDQP